MDVLESIRTLRAVRTYEDRPVPDETARTILEAARLTGSASNAQPWHFIVVKNRDILRQLADIATTGPYIAEAPLAIVVVIDRKSISISDASRAIQSMMLAAWAEGVGSNWVGYRGMDAVRPLLGIPDDRQVLAILPFGYPLSPAGQGQKNRKPLTEIASRERYGEPFE